LPNISHPELRRGAAITFMVQRDDCARRSPGACE
jgi:hypothetical protein